MPSTTYFKGKVVRIIAHSVYTSLIFFQIAITGAASGMGLATAELLASRGASISLADINKDAVQAAAHSLPNSEQHIYKVVDVSKPVSVDEWIAKTVQHYGRLDGAVNMAGVIVPATPVTELSDKDWDMTFSVNTKGIFNCLRAQLRAMSAGGSIVQTPLSRRLNNE